jgi:hypothetical protein
MKSLLTFTNVFLPLLLGGCVRGCSRPNTSEAEFKLDRFQCEQQAASIYPIVIESFGTGHEAPSQSNCSSYAGHMNCTATPGAYIPPRQVDVNANARANEVRSCLQSKGYVSKPVNGPSKSNPPRLPKSEEDMADAISRFPVESASYVPGKRAAVSTNSPY